MARGDCPLKGCCPLPCAGKEHHPTVVDPDNRIVTGLPSASWHLSRTSASGHPEYPFSGTPHLTLKPSGNTYQFSTLLTIQKGNITYVLPFTFTMQKPAIPVGRTYPTGSKS